LGAGSASPTVNGCDSGSLELRWHTLPPRRIALLEIPQLKVRFVYRSLNEEQRHRMQKCFDLQTHRGGG
jgi:hypothetical protein